MLSPTIIFSSILILQLRLICFHQPPPHLLTQRRRNSSDSRNRSYTMPNLFSIVLCFSLVSHSFFSSFSLLRLLLFR
ncbi:hypothetical protein RchiOBHm_Chr7g0223521 [Rosa chinensis]|uniref:Uncharacterized protein n=1 Tax=Rosa chinensis TaxID=74649 RepID=A0A2P6PDL4_ROSCH|nr:hypothetical protein RchiOBHm_Chr7g0223521 [Rosa chinensis]